MQVITAPKILPPQSLRMLMEMVPMAAYAGLGIFVLSDLLLRPYVLVESTAIPMGCLQSRAIVTRDTTV